MKNKEMIATLILSIIVSIIFYQGYGNNSAIKTRLDMIWFNFGCFLPMIIWFLYIIHSKFKGEIKDGKLSSK